ncbi:MAG TPA: hypothetical protein VFK79_09670 [Xanthobacteraceae bacterium]|nr:hypothetical protein [Xanthobacteraceae bacterium]
MTILLVVGAGLSAGSALAQEDLNRGKTPAQLFASDCADCHRNPRSLGKRENADTLAGFLRVHYTASRESAAAIAAYLVSLGPDPRAGSRPTSQRSKPAASQDQSKSNQTQPAAKPAEPAPPEPPEPVPQAPLAAPANEPVSEPTPAAPPANPQ